jgi:hypothetical protein
MKHVVYVRTAITIRSPAGTQLAVAQRNSEGIAVTVDAWRDSQDGPWHVEVDPDTCCIAGWTARRAEAAVALRMLRAGVCLPSELRLLERTRRLMERPPAGRGRIAAVHAAADAETAAAAARMRRLESRARAKRANIGIAQTILAI